MRLGRLQGGQNSIEYKSLLVGEIKVLEKLLPCNTYLLANLWKTGNLKKLEEKMEKFNWV